MLNSSVAEFYYKLLLLDKILNCNKELTQQIVNLPRISFI